MPQRREKKGPSAKDRRPIKKKTSILNSENIAWIDYKDVNLLRRFMSERAKIRARRDTGNDQQQQAAVAKAIKLSREMALLPYSVRHVQQRTKGRGRDRRDADLTLELEGPPPEGEEIEAIEGIEGVDGAESVDGEVVDTAEAADDGADVLAEVSEGGESE